MTVHLDSIVARPLPVTDFFNSVDPKRTKFLHTSYQIKATVEFLAIANGFRTSSRKPRLQEFPIDLTQRRLR